MKIVTSLRSHPEKKEELVELGEFKLLLKRGPLSAACNDAKATFARGHNHFQSRSLARARPSIPRHGSTLRVRLPT